MVTITNMLVALVAVAATGVAARKKDCTPNGKLFCGYHLNDGEFGMLLLLPKIITTLRILWSAS